MTIGAEYKNVCDPDVWLLLPEGVLSVTAAEPWPTGSVHVTCVCEPETPEHVLEPTLTVCVPAGPKLAPFSVSVPPPLV